MQLEGRGRGCLLYVVCTEGVYLQQHMAPGGSSAFAVNREGPVLPVAVVTARCVSLQAFYRGLTLLRLCCAVLWRAVQIVGECATVRDTWAQVGDMQAASRPQPKQQLLFNQYAPDGTSCAAAGCLHALTVPLPPNLRSIFRQTQRIFHPPHHMLSCCCALPRPPSLPHTSR
jgi:hypothetical protein